MSETTKKFLLIDNECRAYDKYCSPQSAIEDALDTMNEGEIFTVVEIIEEYQVEITRKAIPVGEDKESVE